MVLKGSDLNRSEIDFSRFQFETMGTVLIAHFLVTVSVPAITALTTATIVSALLAVTIFGATTFIDADILTLTSAVFRAVFAIFVVHWVAEVVSASNNWFTSSALLHTDEGTDIVPLRITAERVFLANARFAGAAIASWCFRGYTAGLSRDANSFLTPLTVRTATADSATAVVTTASAFTVRLATCACKADLGIGTSAVFGTGLAGFPRVTTHAVAARGLHITVLTAIIHTQTSTDFIP